MAYDFIFFTIQNPLYLWLFFAIVVIGFILYKDQLHLKNLTDDKLKLFLYILLIILLFYVFIYM
jgi:hypothetical protein